MSLIFHYAPDSTASVTAGVIAELGLEVERRLVPIGPAGTRSAAFRALNPNGTVPVLEHDGVVIWESAAITLHLADLFGVAAGLWPAPGPQRGAATKWVVWANVVLAEAGGRLAMALPSGTAGGVDPALEGVLPDLSRGEAAAAQARTDLARILAILEGALADRAFLCGTYTLADTHLSGFVGWLELMGIDLAPYPHTARWLGACASRPAIAAQFGGAPA